MVFDHKVTHLTASAQRYVSLLSNAHNGILLNMNTLKTLIKAKYKPTPRSINLFAGATISLMLVACGGATLDDIQDNLANGEDININISINDNDDLVISLTDNDGGTDTDDTAFLSGFQMGETLGNVDETISNLETILNNNDAISIVAQIDHQANAASVGLDLRPTSVTLFGNPNLGTPLMQINQLTGLDLPQKMFAREDATGQSNIAYNSADYLSSRYGLSEGQATLDIINNALGSLATGASGQEFTPVSVITPSMEEGIVVVQSANDMETTFGNLQQAIDSAGPLTIVAVVDHSANAESVGLSLRPTRLVVFGNPNLGTPLMQSGQSIGIDLPQKMLVYTDADGQVMVAYNDPAFLAERHGISDQADIINTITQALGNLAGVATSAP